MEEKQYYLYDTGPTNNTHHGMVILVRKACNAEFKQIPDRTCIATVKLKANNSKLTPIHVYSPPLEG